MLGALLDLFVPHRCVLCASISTTVICRACQHDFLLDSVHRCDICGIDLVVHTTPLICGDCLKTPPHFDRSIVATSYLSPNDGLVLRLKFAQGLPAAEAMAFALRDRLLDLNDLDLPHLIAPVPLGALRLQQRGYNQALELTRHLARQLGIPYAPQLLRRAKETLAQSQLSPDQRTQNMRNAFAINSTQRDFVSGAHIAIVDDVMTTGTTLNAIAKELKRFGAHKVTNLVFARTPKHRID